MRSLWLLALTRLFFTACGLLLVRVLEPRRLRMDARMTDFSNWRARILEYAPRVGAPAEGRNDWRPHAQVIGFKPVLSRITGLVEGVLSAIGKLDHRYSRSGSTGFSGISSRWGTTPRIVLSYRLRWQRSGGRFKLNSLTVGLVLLAVYLRATRIVVLSVDWN